MRQLLIIILIVVAPAMAYELPPSEDVYEDVPPISDEAMAQCILYYNEALDIEYIVEANPVDLEDPASVYHYNSLVDQYLYSKRYYNENCAGKQSETAARIAKELAAKNGKNNESKKTGKTP